MVYIMNLKLAHGWNEGSSALDARKMFRTGILKQCVAGARVELFRIFKQKV